MYALLGLALLTISTQAKDVNYCPLLGPIFPAPTGISNDPLFVQATTNITNQLHEAIKAGSLSSDSVSIQIFSGKESKSTFSFSHTDDSVKNGSVGIREVDEDTADIARDYAFGDLAFSSDAELKSIGLPTIPKSEKLTCGSTDPCDRKAFFNGILETRPLAPISLTLIYSNAGFQILGYALETIAKRPYDQILKERLIRPLNLTRSSYSAPNASMAIIPGNLTESWFNVPVGDETPAGGLYSSAKDMATVGRAILSSALVHPAVTRKWMKPASHTASLELSVGHPWEIFSLNEPRVIDLYTKSGDLGKYSSLIALSPDHEAGFAILAAGEQTSKSTALIAEKIVEVLVPTLEEIAKKQAKKRFAGTFALNTSSNNSSITIVADDGPGLKVSEWISNSLDMFHVLMAQSGYTDRSKFSIRLQPRGLESSERIAFSAVIQGLESEPKGGPLLRVCQTWFQLDAYVYGNVGLSEFLFELNKQGKAVSLTSPALRVSLAKT